MEASSGKIQRQKPSSILERTKNYEASCQASSTPSSPKDRGQTTGKSSGVAERMRQRFGERDSSATKVPAANDATPSSPEDGYVAKATGKSSAVAERMRQRFGARDASKAKAPLPKRTLANITEQRVLKAGVARFHKDFVVVEAGDIMTLPKRGDGSSMLMQTSFFERLLSERLELKSSLESDVAAAQPDLRHLSMEQLLSIRAETLDFLTESEKHSAHNNFLNTLDHHLFEKLTFHCLQRYDGNLTSHVTAEGLYKVGFRLGLMLGAVEMFRNGWDVPQGQTLEEFPSVPSCWVMRLDDQQSEGSSFAIFNTEKLWLKVMSSVLDFGEVVPSDERLAVVLDRSSGSGQTRTLHLEVSCLDTHGPAAEVAAEIERRSRVPGLRTNRNLLNDLNSAMQNRRCARLGFTESAEATDKPDASTAHSVKPVADQAMVSGEHVADEAQTMADKANGSAQCFADEAEDESNV